MNQIAWRVSLVSGVCKHRYRRRFCGFPARATLTRPFLFFLLRCNQPAKKPDTDLGRQTDKTHETRSLARRTRMSSGEAAAASPNHRAASLLLMAGGRGQFATPCASGNGPHLGLYQPRSGHGTRGTVWQSLTPGSSSRQPRCFSPGSLSRA
jgi:hypothetical protein